MIRTPPIDPLNSPTSTDGDQSFIGFRSRPAPRSLQPGLARYIGNMRLDQQVAKVRAGNLELASDITLAGAPLVLNFALAADTAVTSITRAGATATVTTTSPHGFSTGDLVNIRGASQTEYNGDFTIAITGGSTFTYTVSGTPASPATGTIIANQGPIVAATYNDTVFASCVYHKDGVEGLIIATQAAAYAYRYGEATEMIAYPADESIDADDICDMKQFMDKVFLVRGKYDGDILAITSVTRAGATVTVTTTAAHGLATNDWVTISDAGEYQYNGIWQITVTGGSTFTYAIATTPTSPATGTITTWKTKAPLTWDCDTASDFIRVTTGGQPTGTTSLMPASDWVEHFYQRLVLPYDTDEIVYSDILDTDTYDLTNSELRIMPGTNDWLIGIHPYQDFQFLVYYRKSIHVVVFDHAAALYGVKEITRDIGCASRKTIITCGNEILWLSEQGVHRLAMGDTLSLRGDTLPLSDPIQDLIQRINWEYIDRAVAIYYRNRYYLCVPLDDAQYNNTMLIYNFINREWESVDTFPTDFYINGLHIMSYAGEQRLHCASNTGWIYLMEQNDAGDQFGEDGAGNPLDNAVEGTFNSRGYAWGSTDAKRMKRVQVSADFDTGDIITVTAQGYNPDSSASVITFTATQNSDALLRATSRARGEYCTIDIASTSGRPEIRAIKGDATIDDKQVLNQV